MDFCGVSRLTILLEVRHNGCVSKYRCPHDAWLEQLVISEPSTGKRREKRSIGVSIRLLGAYHDGFVEYEYDNVRQYSFQTPSEPQRVPVGLGHGDFLIDEIRLSEGGWVEHEIEFRHGTRLLIGMRHNSPCV
jgi:hypothetical protein